MRAATRLFPSALLLAALVACGGAPAERRPLGEAASADAARPTLPPPVQAAVDSGNLAFRARDYPAALRWYREAARRGPGEPAPWFGINMAAQALGDRALADSARARLRELAPGTAGDAHHPGGAPPVDPPDSAAAARPAS